VKWATAQRAEEEMRIRSLASGTIEEKIDSAMWLGKKRSRAGVGALVRALDDPNQSVRAWSVWALGEIGDRSTVRPILEALKRSKRIADNEIIVDMSKCLPDFYTALEKLTGKRYGRHVEKRED
jgi:HEAT repeat protein